MVKRDLYDHDQIVNSLVKQIPEWSFSDSNSNDLQKFYEELTLEGLSKARLLIYLQKIQGIIKLLPKDLSKIDERDVKRLIMHLMERNAAAETISMYLITLKKFMRLVYGSVPEPIEKLRVRIGTRPYMKPLLTYSDSEQLSDAATNLRDKAIPLSLYESGARIGEFLNASKQDAVFDEYGCILNVDGKTGQRPIRLVSSSPALANYVSTTLRDFPDTHPLFVCIEGPEKGKAMTYAALAKLLRTLKKRSGIRKSVNPHHFRHSRATELASQLTDRQMCQFFGWSPGSKQPGRYSHLSGRDVHEKILNIYGLKTAKEEEKRPQKCARCARVNDRRSRFCSGCGAVLDIKTATEVMEAKKEQDDMMERLMADHQVREFLAERMRKLSQKDP